LPFLHAATSTAAVKAITTSEPINRSREDGRISPPVTQKSELIEQ
jgi:hypothetical protein